MLREDSLTVLDTCLLNCCVHVSPNTPIGSVCFSVVDQSTESYFGHTEGVDGGGVENCILWTLHVCGSAYRLYCSTCFRRDEPGLSVLVAGRPDRQSRTVKHDPGLHGAGGHARQVNAQTCATRALVSNFEIFCFFAPWQTCGVVL